MGNESAKPETQSASYPNNSATTFTNHRQSIRSQSQPGTRKKSVPQQQQAPSWENFIPRAHVQEPPVVIVDLPIIEDADPGDEWNSTELTEPLGNQDIVDSHFWNTPPDINKNSIITKTKDLGEGNQRRARAPTPPKTQSSRPVSESHENWKRVQSEILDNHNHNNLRIKSRDKAPLPPTVYENIQNGHPPLKPGVGKSKNRLAAQSSLPSAPTNFSKSKVQNNNGAIRKITDHKPSIIPSPPPLPPTIPSATKNSKHKAGFKNFQ